MTELKDKPLDERVEADPPMYFKRLWDPERSHPGDEVVAFKKVGSSDADNDVLIFTGRASDMPEGFELDARATQASIYSGPLLIYGRKVVSSFPEDQEYMDTLEAEGFIFTESFSVACVEGELGSQPLSELTEIDADEFEAARARGWT